MTRFGVTIHQFRDTYEASGSDTERVTVCGWRVWFLADGREMTLVTKHEEFDTID